MPELQEPMSIDAELRIDIAGMNTVVWWALSLNLFCTFCLWLAKLTPMYIPAVVTLVLGIFANSLCTSRLASRVVRIRLFYRLTGVLNVVLVTMIVHFLGGVACLIAPMFYALIIVNAGIEPTTANLLAVISAIAYGGMIVLEHPAVGLIAPYWDPEVPRVVLPLSAQITLGILATASLVLVAAFRNRFGELLQERRRALLKANTELAEYRGELEALVRARTMALETSYRDLTSAYQQLRETQRQLLQSEKMASLGQLVAGVAHEINNPVSFIVSNLRPLMKRIEKITLAVEHIDDAGLRDDVTRLGEIVRDIGSGADRTAGIVRDLRTFSRINEAPRATCDVRESLEVALRLLKPKWYDRVEIDRIYGALPLIHGVPGQLNQVFMNLLANAFDAISGTGRVRIVTTVEGEHVRVAIQDDGSGIPAERLDRIFDPFFTTKAFGQGTGLGLSISHGIVEDHGGRIEVQSTVGEGTTFAVVLPIRERAVTRSALPGAAAEPSTPVR